MWGEREQAMQLVGKLMLRQCITRSQGLYSLQSVTRFLHVRVQRNCRPDVVNSVPCMEKYHTIEPFVLPKPLLSLGFSVHTLTGKD